MSLPQQISTIQRDPHDNEHPCAVVSRALIRDETISPECRWLLIYLLSMKDGWKIKVSQIWHHVRNFIGRDKVYRLIEEAIEAGYMRREEIFRGNLKSGCKYYVSESPKLKKSFRHPDSRDAGGQDTETQEALRSTLSSSKEEDKKGIASPEPLPPPLFQHGNVKMLQSKADGLIQTHGIERFNAYIENLNTYAETHPKKFKAYGCHAAVIRSWIRKDERKGSEEIKRKEFPKTIKEENRIWAMKAKSVIESLKDVEFVNDGVLFYSGSTQKVIKFEDIGFKESILSRLHTKGIKTEGL